VEKIWFAQEYPQRQISQQKRGGVVKIKREEDFKECVHGRIKTGYLQKKGGQKRSVGKWEMNFYSLKKGGRLGHLLKEGEVSGNGPP